MPRIRRYERDGMLLEISPLSFDEAQKFMEESAAFRKNAEITDKDWENRTLNTIIHSLNKAAGKKVWSVDGAEDTRNVRSEFDMVMVEDVFREILEMSGLMRKTVGEVPATSTGS